MTTKASMHFTGNTIIIYKDKNTGTADLDRIKTGSAGAKLMILLQKTYIFADFVRNDIILSRS